MVRGCGCTHGNKVLMTFPKTYLCKVLYLSWALHNGPSPHPKSRRTSLHSSTTNKQQKRKKERKKECLRSSNPILRRCQMLFHDAFQPPQSHPFSYLSRKRANQNPHRFRFNSPIKKSESTVSPLNIHSSQHFHASSAKTSLSRRKTSMSRPITSL